MEIFFILLILAFFLYEHNSRRAKKRILEEKLESERNWIRAMIVGSVIRADQWVEVVECARQATEWLLSASHFTEAELRSRFDECGVSGAFSMIVNALHTTPEKLRQRLDACQISGHEAGLLIAEQIRQLQNGERGLNEEEVALIRKVHADVANDKARDLLKRAEAAFEAGEISSSTYNQVVNNVLDSGVLKPENS